MRIYRLQIRIIQLSVILTMIVMVFGLVNVWKGNAVGQPVGGDNISQNSNGGNPDKTGTPGGNPPANGNSQLVNKKIVCLGDSYTIGYPGEPKDSWPVRVAEILKIEVINAGKTFQNTEDLLARFDQDVAAKEPGRVVIFAGVGDALRDKPFEEYQKNIMALVDKAQSKNIIPVLALPIPYPGTEKLYAAYREWEITYAQEKKLTVLDFKKVLYDEQDKILQKYSSDGKYPNKDGYAAMGDYAATILK